LECIGDFENSIATKEGGLNYSTLVYTYLVFSLPVFFLPSFLSLILFHDHGSQSHDTSPTFAGAVIEGGLWDDQGSFLGCLSIKVEGITNPVPLDAMACAEALSLATELQARNFQVAVDCLGCVSLVEKRPSIPVCKAH
jgi:hypothetical protein